MHGLTEYGYVKNSIYLKKNGNYSQNILQKTLKIILHGITDFSYFQINFTNQKKKTLKTNSNLPLKKYKQILKMKQDGITLQDSLKIMNTKV